MKIVFLLIAACVFAEIRDIYTMAEFRKYVDKEALILFDLDNTVMEASQTLGSDQWFTQRQKDYVKKGYSPAMALENALAEWMAIQNLTQVQLVEGMTRDLIDDLQTQKIPLMGLTTRGMGMALRTIDQLASLGIDLTKTAPFQHERFFVTERGVIFRGGILFTAGTHKGRAFLELFKEALPPKVIFINDKASHLKEIEEVCNEKNIPFLGLRYGYLGKQLPPKGGSFIVRL